MNICAIIAHAQLFKRNVDRIRVRHRLGRLIIRLKIRLRSVPAVLQRYLTKNYAHI